MSFRNWGVSYLTASAPWVESWVYWMKELGAMAVDTGGHTIDSLVASPTEGRACKDHNFVYKGCSHNLHNPMWLVSMNRRIATYYLRSREFYQTKPSRLAALEGGFFGTRGSI